MSSKMKGLAETTSGYTSLISLLTMISTAATTEIDLLIPEGPTGKPCRYFGSTRVSAPQGNLINCTWYSSNACCRRTEVTSVFGGMYPLYGANEECANQVNYLMCYFCSPDQYIWYDKQVHVCAEYCQQVYDSCFKAEYQGQGLGVAYKNGQEFCEGQGFKVIDGKTGCFDFDPTVFGSAVSFHNWQLHFLVVLCIFVKLCRN